MIKIKVIDLLNKIANKEEVPKKITYKDKIYYADVICSTGKYYYYDGIDTLLLEVINNVEQLNDEVEILEDKMIKKLYLNDEYLFSNNLSKEFTREDRRLLDSNFETIRQKFNEIIDYINKGE